MAGLMVDSLVKEYPTAAEPLRILDGISFSLQSGENLAIVGPSGSGKSTLLNLLGGLDTPSSGRVTLDGEDPAQLPPKPLARFRNRRIGFVFQDHHLLPQCTVLENVLIPTLADGQPNDDELSFARELLDRVGLSRRSDHLPGELSGGERQRTAIARALIRRPDLLLADEPTGNLDRHTAEKVAALLLELQQEQDTMLIVVTHSRQLASRLSEQMELADGKLTPLSVS